MSDERDDGMTEERLQRMIVEQKLPVFIEEAIVGHPSREAIVDLLERGALLFLKPPNRADGEQRFELYAGWPADARFRRSDVDPSEMISVARFHSGVLA